ncbi:hypothetical protein TDB9533_00493 [Thalassocella blandensis]|nr:hypothetical protein TDB9533_00493 [Thalassocella blandensis]
MSITKKIKNHSSCGVHSCMHKTNVCPHIMASIKKEQPVLKVTPIFLERILINKYYEQYWLCSECANEFDIASIGELYFDPKLRILLESDSDDDDDTLKVELKSSLHDIFECVCLDCFNDKYGIEADHFRKEVGGFKQISIRDET